MDTRPIVVLVVAAVVALALLVLGGTTGKAKRRGRKRELRRKPRREGIAAEKHRAPAEVAEACSGARRARPAQAELHERWVREIDRIHG